MTGNYLIFRKFPTLLQALELKEMLQKNGMPSIVDDNVPPVDVTFSGNTIQHQFEIRIKPSDFEQANMLLEKHAESLIDNMDKGYYLFEFTNNELYDVLLKSDEWSTFDYTLAKSILKQRGKSIDKALLDKLKDKRLKNLAKPEKNQEPWIIAGYIFSVLGGFLGLIIGYFLWTSKKTLPNGQRIYSYSKNDRRHGRYIFYIGLIFTPISLLLRVIDQF